MTRYLIGCFAAVVCALTVSVAAQNPSQDPPAQQQAKPPAQELAATVTVEGCLVTEEQVPGRKPNIAAKAGVREDYILTNALMIKGTAPKAAAAEPKPGEPVGTAGALAPMFDVKGIEGSQLKQFVGKRVQIDGTFADVEKSATAGAAEDLVDIKGTAIREVSGKCPVMK